MARLADMNLPNSLSITRIFLVPLLVVVLLTKFEGRMLFGVRKELVGAAIFGIASLTDWLDVPLTFFGAPVENWTETVWVPSLLGVQCW